MALKGKAKKSKVLGKVSSLRAIHGYSAYELAVINGFKGTEEEWLASLKGDKGDKGEANYSIVANALKGSASGTSAIRIDDVSPLEHGIKTKVLGAGEDMLGVGEFICSCINSSQAEFKSGAGFYEISAIKLPVSVNYGDDESPDWQVEECGELHFTDGSLYVDEAEEIYPLEQWNTFSVGEKLYFDGWEEANLYRSVSIGSSVTRYGKNLFDFKQDVSRITYIGSSGTSQRWGYDIHLPAGTYTAKAYGTNSSNYVYGMIVDADGKYKKNYNLVTASSYTPQKIIIEEGEYLKIYNGMSAGTESQSNNMFKKLFDIQLEVGTTATDYEPYKEPVTFTADENGNITVPSLAPTTTIVADSGVSMTAEYNRDINKAFNELYQAIATMGAAAVTIPEEV